ncbi:MAG: hypothetical protein AB1696_01820 [Planctomycetota bacterium]
MNKTTGKPVSEQWFETYLKERQLTDFEYHPSVEDATKHPDYRVVVGGSEVFFEVTEFDTPTYMPNKVGAVDLSTIRTQIRKKIERERQHLKDLKGRMCAIVLADPHDSFRFLKQRFIIEAMLGALGLTMPYDGETGACDSSRMTSTFAPGGKMVRWKNGNPLEPQNTTISAVCVLGMVDEGARRLGIRIKQRIREAGQPLDDDAALAMLNEAESANADDSLYHLRVQIYENPCEPKAPLTEAFGTGPHDERFGVRDGRWQRVFVGDSLNDLEADERAAGIKPNGPFDLGLRTKGE